MLNRRDFLCCLAGAAAGTTLLRPLWWPAMARGSVPGTVPGGGRVLVLVVFQGGNDGLNTVVPYGDPGYYALRPTVGVAKNTVLDLDGVHGFHPALAPLMPLWEAGKVAVVQGVGYPNMNLSHFRSTDIVFSGSNAETVWSTGWVGRWLQATHPDFPDVLPPAPLGLQQGFSAQLPLQGERGPSGAVVDDPAAFYQIVNATYAGSSPDEDLFGRGGDELAYIRQVDIESFEYAGVIQEAANQGQALAAYPQGSFGTQMATVARLIEGGLDTGVYLTAFKGFDTHGSQRVVQDGLLGEFAAGVAALLSDLERAGRADDVVVLTVSEFGRRTEENGSDGTDHGTAAPWFLIGNGVAGGLHGTHPPLDALDPFGNLIVQVDFRAVYATVMRDWFGTDTGLAASVLDGEFGALPLFGASSPAGPASRGAGVLSTRLFPPRPNPGRGPRSIRFDLADPGRVDLSVMDVQGHRVDRVFEGTLSAGAHERTWDPTGRFAAGVYFLVLDAGGRQQVRKLIVR